MRNLAGYDFAVQALSGLMSITGPVAGPPTKVGVAMADVVTGLHAAVAVLACLHARARSGHGYAIDLALLDCAVAAQVNVAQAFLTDGTVPARQGNAHLQIVPYQLFATADGWLVLAVGNDGQWQRFCAAAGRADLAADPRYATNVDRVHNRSRLVPLLEDTLRRKTSAAWQETLRAADVPHAPVWNYAELFQQPQAAARNLRMTVRDTQGRSIDLVGTPFHIEGADLSAPTAPPMMGQHTEEVLKELLGLEPARIEALHRLNVI